MIDRNQSVTVLLHHEDGELWAEVLEYPGCFAAGADMSELEESLTEALSLYLSTPERPVRVTLDLVHSKGASDIGEAAPPDVNLFAPEDVPVERRNVQLCAA